MAANLDKQITIIDGEGNEHIMEVLFTADNEERGVSYVFFYDPADPDNVIPMRYNEETGELFDIEDDDEYAEVEEIFNAYEEDPQIQDLKNNK